MYKCNNWECGYELEDEQRECPYCGFFHTVKIDMDDKKIDSVVKKHVENYLKSDKWKQSIAYKKKQVLGISNISIVSYQYGWKENEKKFDLLDRKVIELANGEQCYQKSFWSEQDFGQTISDDIKDRELEFEYTFNGEKKVLKCNITPVKCDDFWHVGLRITDQLKLIVYLGRENKYAESKPMDLELK